MVDIVCICPPTAGGETRHPDGDRVELRERLDFRSSLTIRNAVAVMKVEDPEAGVAEILAVLTEQYIIHGVESWTLTDERGAALPVTRGAIRDVLLPHTDAALAVADAADDLYQEAVMLPLLGESVDVLAAYADGRIDISDDWLADRAPDAVEAILDYHYPDGRHRADFNLARWRLQLIAEVQVGSVMRAGTLAEDSQVRKLRSIGGRR